MLQFTMLPPQPKSLPAGAEDGFLPSAVSFINMEVVLYLQLNIGGSCLHNQWKQNGMVLYQI
jgi:hypothetical protein